MNCSWEKPIVVHELSESEFNTNKDTIEQIIADLLGTPEGEVSLKDITFTDTDSVSFNIRHKKEIMIPDDFSELQSLKDESFYCVV